MEYDWTPPDTWLVVLEADGSSTHADPADEGMLDAALSRYVDSGCTRDEILCLTLSEGGNYHVRASRISGWWLNTPEHTRRNLFRTAAQRENRKTIRAELGLPWTEDDE